ncbi:MAG TPA: hypothetical protein H9700_14545 [Candidatus Eisenbergiella intestinipullorum]|nr:hypothetical protein [Candidatus Eisenbergiella intestinipullorum]
MEGNAARRSAAAFRKGEDCKISLMAYFAIGSFAPKQKTAVIAEEKSHA